MKTVLRILFYAWLVLTIGPTGAAPLGEPDDPYLDRDRFRTNGPLTPAERSAPWPSRDQPASEYRDAFCMIWNDGCTRCNRDPRGTRLTFCNVMSDQTCERKPIICERPLPTAARVCLMFDDGCNKSSYGNGAATAVLCRRPKNGVERPWRGVSCDIPRRADAHRGTDFTPDDLAGHWWLVSPRGKTCLVTLNSILGIWPNAPCAPEIASLLESDPQPYESWIERKLPCTYRTHDLRLSIVCERGTPGATPTKARHILTFSIRDMDHPVGTGADANWKLLRVSTLY